MKTTLVSIALLVAVALPVGGLAQPEARQGHVPDLLRSQGAGAVRARRGDAALVLVHGSAQGVRRGRSQQDPELRDGVLGPRRRTISATRWPRPPSPKDARGRLGGAREGARDRREDPARARLDRGDRRLLPRPRQGAARRPARRLHQGDGAADAALPRRLRGLGVLRADACRRRRPRTTRPTPTSSSRRRSSSACSSRTRSIPAWRTISSTPTTTRRSPTRASRSRAATRGIAPAAPHARHMPSHIYSMVGMWEESIASNRVGARDPARLLPRDRLHRSTRTSSSRRTPRRRR